jgi:D-aminopeptidase
MKYSISLLRYLIFTLTILLHANLTRAQDKRPREYGIKIGVLQPGTNNAITDVLGVKVGHSTIIEGENIRTGVTAIIPHGENILWVIARLKN